MSEIVATPVDPAEGKLTALPAEQFFQIKLYPEIGVIDIGGMARMDPAADVTGENAVVEREHFYAGGEPAIAIASPIARRMISFVKAAGG